MTDYPLQMLTFEEKKVLYKLFEIEQSNDIDEVLNKRISKLLLPAGGTFQKGLSYEDMILKIANKRKFYFAPHTTLYEKEQKLFLEIFKENYNDMSDAEREDFLYELKRQGLSSDQVASVAAIASLSVAQLSGFGVYLLATSTVGAITSALGITLSFGFYTAMSSFISYAIGPIGFAIAAIPLYKSFKDVRNFNDLKIKLKEIYKGGKILVKGNYEGAELILKYFASLRIMKIHEMELRIDANTREHVQSLYKIKSLEDELNKSSINKLRLDKEISDLQFQLNSLKNDQVKLVEKESLDRREKSTLSDRQSYLLKENEEYQSKITNFKK